MASEKNVPLTVPAGVTKTRTGEGAKGKWLDARNIRFVDGGPEKRAGYIKLNTTPFEGRARGMLAWNTVKGNPLYALGTNLRLYGSTDGVEIKNITPLRFNFEVEDAFSVVKDASVITFKLAPPSGQTLTNPFTTTNASTTVTVAHEAHGKTTGAKVGFSGATASGGITINGVYTITVVDDDSYTIAHTAAATSGTTGGGTVTYTWEVLAVNQIISFYGNAYAGGTNVGGIIIGREYRVLSIDSGIQYKIYSNEAVATLTNPFAMTNGSKTVTVTDTAHGQETGKGVYYEGATAVGGQTVSGQYTITVVNDDSYTIQLAANASSTATGGGTVKRSFADRATADATNAGGKVNYVLRVSDPFSVSNGSTVLLVTQEAHGALYNDLVIISDADDVGGQDVNGERRVLEVVDANTYKLRMDGAATSTATGGGSSVLIEYEITTGPLDRVLARRGYGQGSYGLGAYGSTTLELDPVYYEPRHWSLSKEGEDMIAGVLGGSVFYWDSSVGSRAELIPNAPREIRYAFQTEERHLHVLGVNGDPLVMAWASQGNVNEWTPTETNTANSSRRVREGSALIAGTPVSNGVNLIWTDTACYVHQHTGSQFIYDTRLASRNAGLIGPGAYAVTPDGVFWMSQKRFLMWNGSVQPVPRADEIQEWIFAQIVDEQKSKCWAHYDAVNNSIDFYFVPNGKRELLPSGEPVSYVTLNLEDYSWCLGEEDRTTGATFNTGAQNPYRCALNGYVYKHEVGLDHDGQAAESWIELSPLDLGSGAVWMDIFGFDPDMKRQVGDVDVTIRTYDRNPASIVDEETVAFSEDDEIVDLRSSGRRMSLRLSQTLLGGDFAIDTPQLLVAPSGARR